VAGAGLHGRLPVCNAAGDLGLVQGHVPGGRLGIRVGCWKGCAIGQLEVGLLRESSRGAPMPIVDLMFVGLWDLCNMLRLVQIWEQNACFWAASRRVTGRLAIAARCWELGPALWSFAVSGPAILFSACLTAS